MPRILPLLAAFIPLAQAGIQFTSPRAGDTLTAGSAISVEWQDGGSGPALSALTTYELALCAGGNEPSTITILLTITTAGQFAAGSKASGLVGVGVGDNTPKNAYFLRIIATASTGGTLTVYSPRFSYTGMEAKFPDAVIKAMDSVKGTDGPAIVDGTTGAKNAPADSEFAVNYTMQTGATRYAPMQPIPATKIAKQKPTPQFPTSSVVVARTQLPIGSVQTTVTQSQTHKVSSLVNTAAAAPMPSDDMAKFLARWKD